MKLCSFTISIKSKKKENSVYLKLQTCLLNINKNQLSDSHGEMGTSFEAVCPSTSLIGYTKTPTVDCFISRASYQDGNEVPIDVFVNAKDCSYEEAIKECLKYIKSSIGKESLKISKKTKVAKIYLTDKAGITNDQIKLSSFYKFSEISNKNKIILLVEVVVLFIGGYLSYTLRNDSLWFSILISSELSILLSTIIDIINVYIRPKKLIMDYENLWEKIIPNKLPNLNYSGSLVAPSYDEVEEK